MIKIFYNNFFNFFNTSAKRAYTKFKNKFYCLYFYPILLSQRKKNFNGSVMKIVLIILVFLHIICCNENPVKSENHQPIIFSLIVFPDVICVQDSAVVICNAFDSDGDTLVYDWITDGRLQIKDGQGDGHFLYNTYENSRIVYSKNINNRPPIDTVWVQCFARDQKGKSDVKLVLFIVKRDSLKWVM